MLKTDEFGPRKMWLGSEDDHLLLFQRTWVWFPASTGGSQPLVTPNSFGGFNTLFWPPLASIKNVVYSYTLTCTEMHTK